VSELSYRTCILATAARTPVGLSAPSAAAAVRAGISRLQAHPRFVDRTGEPFNVAMDRTDDEFCRSKRMVNLALAVLKQVLTALPLDKSTKLPVYLVMRPPDAHFAEEDARRVASAVQKALMQFCHSELHSLLLGHAGGVFALLRAKEAIESGSSPLCVVVGVDSCIDPGFLEFLDEEGLLMSTRNKWGYPPGEGAGALALGTIALARQFRTAPVAGVASVATAMEEAPQRSQGICVGQALGDVILRAAQALDWTRDRVSIQYCDLNGDPYRTEEFMYALQRVSPNVFREPEDYVAPCNAWGDVGAASIPLFAVLATESGARGYAKGPFPLLWAGSEPGHRGAVLLHLPSTR
jgi:3-oxoacyl-[acyl-carrier-protein] synthase I